MLISTILGTDWILDAPLSIDSGRDHDDNSFLESMRAGHSNALTHETTQQALSNVLPSVRATLVGHGKPGIINTGAGGHFDITDAERSLSPEGRAVWGTYLIDRPTTLRSLFLFGCHVGQGRDGGALLVALANALQVKVTAPIGAVWASATNRPCVQDDERFRYAEPGMAQPEFLLPERPQPVLPVPLEVQVIDPLSTDLWRDDNAVLARLRIRDRHGEEGWYGPWTGDDARRLVAAIALDRPLVFSGPLGSLVTGRLFLRLDPRQPTREFAIHSDRMIEDSLNPGLFYPFDLPGLLASWR